MKAVTIREALTSDIQDLMNIRLSVKENVLSDPNKITHADCEEYITQRGKGWVAVESNEIFGFAVADLQENNVWALFVHPEAEAQGIGKRLHDTMVQWYFGQTNSPIWLSTEPHTRAEKFYTQQGWNPKGLLPNGEMKFELSILDWKNQIG